jgi:chromosomal replication initiator protein
MVGTLKVDYIQRVVAEHYGLKIQDINSACRKRPNLLPRHVAMWLCRELTTRSYPELGKKFGDKHHTTVLYGKYKIDKLRSKNPDLQSELDTLRKKLCPA